MADYVVRQVYTLDDQVSAGANAAAAALTNMGAAADTTSTRITAAGASANTLANRFDPATQATNRLTDAQAKLAAAQVTLAAAVAKGSTTQDQATGVLGTLGAKVVAAQLALDALTGSGNTNTAAIGKLATTHGTAANAANVASGAHAGFTRELIVLGHEATVGNYSRIPGSLLVLAERSGTLTSAVGLIGTAFTTFAGLAAVAGVAVVGAFAYMTYEAYEQQKALETLRERLQATRADYDSLALATTAAAKAAAGGAFGIGSTPGFTGTQAEATQAATTLASSAYFVGGSDQLTTLTLLADHLAIALGTTLPEAAKQLAAGLSDPYAEAKKLADEGFRYLDQSVLDTIKTMQTSGDIVGAQSLLFDRLHLSVDGARQAYDALKAAQAAASGGHVDPLTGVPSLGGSNVLLGPVQPDGQQAVGIMQVNPKTAAGVGYSAGDLSTLAGNIAASVAVMATLVQQYGASNQYALAGAYNVGPTNYNTDKNPKAVAAYNAKIAAVNPDDLSAAAANLIDYDAGQKHLDQSVADLLKRIALVESHGQQYTDATSSAALKAAVGEQYGPDAPTIEQLQTGQRDNAQVNDTIGKNSGYLSGNIADDIKNQQAVIDGLTKMKSLVADNTPEWKKLSDEIDGAQTKLDTIVTTDISKAVKDGGTGTSFANQQTDLANSISNLHTMQATVEAGSPAYDQIGEKITDLETKLADLRTPQQKFIDGLQAAIKPLQDTSEGSRAVTAALTDLDKIDKEHNDTQSDSAQRAQVVNLVLEQQSAKYKEAVTAIDLSIDRQQKLGAAWAVGGDQVVQTTAYQQAYTEALKLFPQGSSEFASALVGLTSKYVDLANATEQVNLEKQIAQQSNELQTLQAETDLVSASTDARDRELAILKQRQTLLAAGADIESDAAQKTIANAAAIADATSALQQQQAAISDLTSAATQAFDQVGQALTNAFTQGSVVEWGNVAKAVLASVLQEVLKLAVLNPILNATVGGSRSKLTDVVAAVAGSAGPNGTTVNTGTTSSSLGSLSNLFSIGKAGYSAYSSLSSGTVNTGIGFIDSVANYPLFGGATANAVAGAGSVADSAAGIASAGTAGLTAGATTVAGLAGSIGAGSGLGILLNTLDGGKTVGGDVGAVGGSVAGAAIGSIIPGIGTAIGALIGGIAGGGLGGLIGPGKENSYSENDVDLSNNQLSIGTSISQQDSNAAAEKSSLQSQIDSLNALVANDNLAISGSGFRTGDNTPGNVDSGKVSFGAGLAGLSFTANGTDEASQIINQDISGRSYTSVSDLQADISTITTFVNTTVPALKSFGTVTGTLNDQIASIHDTFDNAITTAGNLDYAESDLTAARDKAIQAASDAAIKQVEVTDQGFNDRYLTAAATVSGSSADAETAQLQAFDDSAGQQRDQLTQSLTDTYGTAVTTWSFYADQIAQLDKTLGEERLAITTQYNDQITAAMNTAAQSAASSLTSIRQYALTLETGTDSALSPQDQYSLAGSQFNAVAGAAKAGDATSIGELTTYATAYLNASKVVNGSGAGYASDYNNVLGVIGDVGAVSSQTLTASFYALQTQTQTATLVSQLQSVVDAVNSVRTQIAQSGGTPGRLVA